MTVAYCVVELHAGLVGIFEPGLSSPGRVYIWGFARPYLAYIIRCLIFDKRSIILVTADDEHITGDRDGTGCVHCS